MENQENKKKGKIIKIIVEIVAVICIAVIMFFVGASSNNSNNDNSINDNNSSNNQETSNKDNDNEVYTVSDTELKKYAELNYRHYSRYGETMDKIERYEDCGNGRYIYIVYYYDWIPGTNDSEYSASIEFIDVSGYPDEVKVSSSASDINNLYENIEARKKRSDEELSWNVYDKTSISNDNDSNNNSSSNNSSSSATSNTYLDDKTIIGLALKKWLDQDSYTKTQYEDNIPSVYSGNISKNSDGSVNVHVTLYKEDIYEQCLQYNLDIDGAKWAERNIKLSKEEVTK